MDYNSYAAVAVMSDEVKILTPQRLIRKLCKWKLFSKTNHAPAVPP